MGFQFTHPGRGATVIALPVVSAVLVFQFTHPGRGATVLTDTRGLGDDVSIHAPREGCDLTLKYSLPDHVVSIHAPREGCDFGYGFELLW